MAQVFRLFHLVVARSKNLAPTHLSRGLYSLPRRGKYDPGPTGQSWPEETGQNGEAQFMMVSNG